MGTIICARILTLKKTHNNIRYVSNLCFDLLCFQNSKSVIFHAEANVTVLWLVYVSPKVVGNRF